MTLGKHKGGELVTGRGWKRPRAGPQLGLPVRLRNEAGNRLTIQLSAIRERRRPPRRPPTPPRADLFPALEHDHRAARSARHRRGTRLRRVGHRRRSPRQYPLTLTRPERTCPSAASRRSAAEWVSEPDESRPHTQRRRPPTRSPRARRGRARTTLAGSASKGEPTLPLLTARQLVELARVRAWCQCGHKPRSAALSGGP